MKSKKERAIGVVLFLLLASVANASVVRVEILETAPVAAPRGSEALGPFERITGKIHGEVDPNDPKNAIITDIKLAPRNAKGRVEYIATFTMVKPVDMTKSSGVLRFTVVNRGGGQAVASPDGHIRLSAAGRVMLCQRPPIKPSGIPASSRCRHDGGAGTVEHYPQIARRLAVTNIR